MRVGAPLGLPSASPGAEGRLVDAPACSNCGRCHVARFCADCGERQPSAHDFSMRGTLLDAFHELTALDGRLLRSVGALIAHPGQLTREWFQGRRSRYVKPFSLFVMLNLAFFLIQPHTQLLSYRYVQYTHSSARMRNVAEARRAKLRISEPAFETRFDAVLQDQKKTLLAFTIPVLALALAVLYVGRGRYIAEHLVFSVHTYAFLLLFMGTVVPAFFLGLLRGLYAAGMRRVPALEGEVAITAILGMVLIPYLYRALRRVYGDAPAPALLRAVVVFILIGQLTGVYHDLLFYTTLYSL